MRSPIYRPSRLALPLAMACLASSPAVAQTKAFSFSVDWHGPMQGTSDSATGTPITPGDILRPAGGVVRFGAPPPDIVFNGGLLGLLNYSACVGSGPGTSCGVEVDALSYGRDFPLPNDPLQFYRILYSVDEYVQGSSVIPGPSITTEAPIGDICGDVLTTLAMPVAPVPPSAQPQHRAMLDGNGLPNPLGQGFVYLGLGASEPNIPGTGLPNAQFDLGDNLDALDLGPVSNPAVDPIWFSVDSGFFDSFAGVPNSGTDAIQGVSGADVLVRLPSGQVQVYATASQLGLDQLGAGTDDLDVLILFENGIPGFQPSQLMFDWLPTGGSDMLLFSVRRGSALIGRTDSLQNLPISEGDLLGPPMSGFAPGNPAIVIAAEALGLSTSRSGGPVDDDLNGGDVEPDEYLDCQPNGIEDAIDIAHGSPDVNMNGIPDECEPPGVRYCFCDAAAAPCGNPDPNAGCANTTGLGADLTGTGSSSVWSDDLVLTTDQMPINKFGIYFMGNGTANAFVADGVRCVGGTAIYRFPAMATGSTGSFSMGPGLVNTANNKWGPSLIAPGTTMFFQSWNRDKKVSPCGTGSNLSNGLGVTFTL